MRVPDEAGVGQAKVTFTFDAWEDGSVSSSSFEIPVIERKSEKK